MVADSRGGLTVVVGLWFHARTVNFLGPNDGRPTSGGTMEAGKQEQSGRTRNGRSLRIALPVCSQRNDEKVQEKVKIMKTVEVEKMRTPSVAEYFKMVHSLLRLSMSSPED